MTAARSIEEVRCISSFEPEKRFNEEKHRNDNKQQSLYMQGKRITQKLKKYI